MKNLPLLIGTVVGTIVLIVVVAFAFSGTGQEVAQVNVPENELVADLRNVKGATESAQVTIVEFSDFQCPACRAAQPMIEQVMERHGDTTRLVYRHFPLDQIHLNARSAAYAAEAAGTFDKFWPMHDLLFEQQEEWATVTDKEVLYEQFATYAQQLQIDKAAFLERIEDSSLQAAVSNDSVYGEKIGINATPTFFVNGQQVPVPQLLDAVESLLNQTASPAASPAVQK